MSQPQSYRPECQPQFLSKTKLESLAALTTAKMRRKRKLFAAEGAKSIADLLPAFSPELLVIGEESYREVEKKAHCENPSNPDTAAIFAITQQINPESIRLATPSDLKRLSGFSTPGNIIAYFNMPDQSEQKTPVLDSQKLYLLLDGVRDPGNFGTIIRTADWFGIHRVFASKDSADVFNPKTIQATMGSLAHVETVYCDLPELVKANPELPLFGTLLQGENIYTAQLPSSGMIAMGNEGKGLSEGLKELVTRPLTIPPFDDVHGESLNVGAATAVVLSEFRQQSFRNPSPTLSL